MLKYDYTINTRILRAELGMYLPTINRGMRKLKRQHIVRSMPRRGCQPYIVDRAVWEKVAKGRAGIRGGSVVEKVRKDTGGNQQEIMPAEKFREVQAEVLSSRRTDINKGKASAKKQAEIGETRGDIRSIS